MRKDEREKLKPETVKKINAYNKQYEREHFDRVTLMFPKGEKEYYKRIASNNAMGLTKFFLMTADEWIERNGE